MISEFRSVLHNEDSVKKNLNPITARAQIHYCVCVSSTTTTMSTLIPPPLALEMVLNPAFNMYHMILGSLSNLLQLHFPHPHVHESIV